MTFYLGSFWYEKDLFYLSAPVYSCTTEGNPCVPATGEKIQTETDIQLAGGVIQFKREYRSQNITGNRGGLGVNWSHGFAKRMDYFPRREELAINTQIVTSRPYNTREEACAHGWEEIRSKAFRGLASNTKATGYRKGVCEIMQGNKLAANLEVHSTLKAAYRPDAVAPPIHVIEHGNGRRYVFQESGGNWFETNSLPVQLKRVGSDWVFTDAGGNTEYYGTDGLIIRLTDMRGKSLFFTYDDNNRLSVISDQFGHRLEFSYDALGNLVSVMGPEGLVEYDYDVNNNLTTVTYPGGSSKTYLYEDPDFPHHLTGITNEKSERFATWKYDDQGRVVISEHAGGADHVAFTYNADHTTTVSDNLGAQRTYHFLLIKGQMKVAEVTGDRCVSCAGGDIQQRIFDSNGFLASTTDWNGNTTTYVRDEWGKELSRTEAAGTPDARIITTDWHPDLPLPIRITGPARITEFNYDTAGRLVSKRVRTAEEQIKEE
jgi:YD repeat-containing protein